MTVCVWTAALGNFTHRLSVLRVVTAAGREAASVFAVKPNLRSGDSHAETRTCCPPLSVSSFLLIYMSGELSVS